MGIATNTNYNPSKAQSSQATRSIDAASAARGTDALRADAANGARLAAAQNIERPNLENRILTFDIDGTLCGRLTEADKVKAEKLGYEVKKMPQEPGKPPDEYPYFGMRPGVQELLTTLQEQGFILVASTRNFPHHAHTMLRSFDLEKHFSTMLFRPDIDSLQNSSEGDFKKFPHHSNNIGKWARLKNLAYRCTIGFVKNIWRWIKSKLSSKVPFYWDSPTGTVNKYPPRFGSRILFDDKIENTDHAKRSGNWYHCAVSRFHGVIEEPKDANGQYHWVNQVLACTNTMRDPNKGWQALIKEHYKMEPSSTKPVEVMEKVRDKVFQPGEYDEYMKAA